MARIGWYMYDPEMDETYVFEVNPYEDNGSNVVSKEVSYAASSATWRNNTGEDQISNVAFGGFKTLERMNYAGRVYTKQQYDDLKEWAEKDYPLQITDDLLRTYLVMIEDVTFSRVRSLPSPYKHTYEFRALILEEVEE